MTRCAVGIFLSDETNHAEFKETMRGVGYSSIHFPEITKAVTSEFPHRTMFSIIIGVFRVYPKLMTYVFVSSCLVWFDS